MSDTYDIFLKQSLHDELAAIRGNKKRAIERFIDYLSENPFDEGDFQEVDRDGREVYCKIVRDHAITYYPDHPVKELKILELVKTP
jgi:hypothetical protein